MKRNSLLQVLLMILGGLVLGLRAEAEVNVSAPFLQNGVGGRPRAMGDCYTAIAEGPFGYLYNPAGLAKELSPAVGFQHETGGLDVRHEALAGKLGLGPGALALGINYFSYGSLETRDENGLLLNEQLNPTDMQLHLGYGLPIVPQWYAGANIGIYSVNLGPSKVGGLVMDLGGAWDFNPQGTLALALKNFGTGIAMPTTARLAGDYRFLNRQLILDAELEFPLVSGAAEMGLGVEYQPWTWFALRSGFKVPTDQSAVEALVFGLGFMYMNFGLDLALASRGDFGSEGMVSFTYLFGSRPEKPVALKKEQAIQVEHPRMQTADVNTQAAFHLKAAQEYERYGQLIDAIVEYQAAIKLKPDYPEAQTGLKAARQKAQTQAQAEKGKEPQSIEANVSVQQMIRKYYERGLEAYKNHDYSSAIKQLQLVLELTTQHRQATELLEKAKAALDQELRVLRNQANQAVENGDLVTEMEAYRKMIELDPENKKIKADLAAAEKKVGPAIERLYKTGLDAYAKGEYRKALRAFESLLKLQPEHAKAKDAVQNIKEKLLKTGQ